MRSRLCLIAALLALAGCNPGAHWTKPGAAAADATAAYEDCHATADAAVEPEAEINEDIEATRQNDWQRSRIGAVETEAMHSGTRKRTADIVDSCMKSKGFTQTPR